MCRAVWDYERTQVSQRGFLLSGSGRLERFRCPLREERSTERGRRGRRGDGAGGAAAVESVGSYTGTLCRC